MFAVLIAVIVVDVWETFAKADEIAAAEANKLSSLMLDTAGLPAAVADAVRTDIDKYIDIVVKSEWPSQQQGNLGEAVFEPGWAAVGRLSTLLAVFDPATMGQNATKAEMLRTVNELIKARRSRILAAGAHLPDVVWGILLIAGRGRGFLYLFLWRPQFRDSPDHHRPYRRLRSRSSSSSSSRSIIRFVAMSASATKRS